MKLLFITWDSDQTNYLESLFLPILEGLQKRTDISCSILQFSWAPKEKVNQLSRLAQRKGVQYTHFRISRAWHPLLGTAWTVYKGRKCLKRYLKCHKVDILMPRSTMPALMLNSLLAKRKKRNYKVVFDADGLPLEERLDFTRLKPTDLQYRLLKTAETRMLLRADRVLTRTQKAINYHLGRMGESERCKFYKVSNGRSAGQFSYSAADRQKIRAELRLAEGELLWVYSGTLGPQYVLKEMLEIFAAYQQVSAGSRFLILSANAAYLNQHLPAHLKDKVIHKKVPFENIPAYLSAADVAFALRQPAWSMRGVAPIKLGEYLLMGLPVVASKGVGDTDQLLLGQSFVNLYEHSDHQRREKALAWVNSLPQTDRKTIREFALQHFTLERSLDEYRSALEGLL